MQELKLVDVNKVYPGGFQAVYDFNIEVPHGEFIVFVGPSGCGKSTVLRMIAGLEEITSGDMYIGSERINNVAPADRDISMVFQNYALYGHMTVYENIGFSQTIRHEQADVIHEKVMAAAEVVDLKDTLNRFPRNISGGQRQRVAMGRSIVSNASIILMDEPLSNLDAKLRVQSRRELLKLHRRLKNTFIYVTHDQTEAMTLADRIVVMYDGRLQQIGTPQEVYFKPENKFVAGFIGSPSMNFINGQIKDNRFIAPGFDLALPSQILADLTSMLMVGPNRNHDQEIVLGIRPEHCTLAPNETSGGRVGGEIQVQEFLGHCTLFYLDIGGSTYVASIAEDCKKTPGEFLEIYPDMSHAHFFDANTGARLHLEEWE
jgi:multiple sugar transport system ATP-binding protein